MFKTKFIGMLMLLTSLFSNAQSVRKEYDVCIYGGTSAGVIAAIQVARMHKSVLLISNYNHVGGMTSSGLGATDINAPLAIGGLSREFYQRIYAYYIQPKAWFTDVDRITYLTSLGKKWQRGHNDSLQMQYMFEPHVAEKVFGDMLSEAKVEVVLNKRLNLKGAGVLKQGNRILSITMDDKSIYFAKEYIDASYEGDLMAKAGVSYIVGRENNKLYGEKLNGILPGKIYGSQTQSIDPYIIPGDNTSGVLPYFSPVPVGNTSESDRRLQAYCYRVTLTTDSSNKLPIIKPDHYEPIWYEHILRKILLTNPKNLEAAGLTLTEIPNKKTDTNHGDFIGANYEWPEGDYQTRDKIAKMHRDYFLGLIWFYANDKRLPKHLNDEMSKYGLAKDEFNDNNNFPYQIYVREARRMISDYVMTEHNYYGRTIAPQSIGLGTYWLDSHVVDYFVDDKAQVRIEGTFWENGEKTYLISYLSIVPKSNECTNLLVPVCLSSSHSAYGSIRMEPVYMVLGQSAAIAAVLSLEKKCSVQQLPYEDLKRSLIDAKQFLSKDAIKNQFFK